MGGRGNGVIRVTAPADLSDLAAIGEPAGSRVRTTTHYDTLAHALAAAEVSLCREVENGRSTWNLTLPGGQAVEVPGGPARPPARIRALLAAVARDAPLEPIATLRTRRSAFRVPDDGARGAELVAESISLLDNQRVRETFSELEVRPQNGERRAVRRLVKRLRRAGARRGDRRAELLQALGLRFDPPARPRPSATSLEHVHARLAAQLHGVLAHDPGVRLGADPEDVHKMRVAVRRARAALRTARSLLGEESSDSLRAELDWLGRILGPVRDTDVLLAHLRDEMATLEPDEVFAAERLVHALDSDREVARAATLEALESDRYFGLLDRLDEAAARPSATGGELDLMEIAKSEFETLRKAAKALEDKPTDEALHRLRIRTKRARYAAELRGEGGGKQARRFIARAQRLQDILGAHQDAVVASARIRELATQTRGGRVAFASGRLVERFEHRRREARASIPSAWGKLERAGRRAWS